jgi:hypothetical protein
MSVHLSPEMRSEVAALRSSGWRIVNEVSVGPGGDAGVMLTLSRGDKRRFVSELMKGAPQMP